MASPFESYYEDYFSEPATSGVSSPKNRYESYYEDLFEDLTPPAPPAEPEPPSYLSRGLEAARRVAEPVLDVAGTPFRGLGMLATEAQEYLAGVPEEESRIKLAAEEPSIFRTLTGMQARAPTSPKLAIEGYRGLAQLGAEQVTGEKLLDITAPGAVGGMRPEEREVFARGARVPASIEAVAEPIAELVLAFGTDPALAGLGRLGNIRAAAAQRAAQGIVPTAAERAAALAQRGIGAAFVPGMATGAIEGAAAAREAYQREGLSPETLRAGTSAAMDAALAGLTGYHALRGGIPAVTPHQAEVLPPGGRFGRVLGEPAVPSPIDLEVLRRETVRPALPPAAEPGGVAAPPEAPRGPRGFLPEPAEDRIARAVEEALREPPRAPRLVPTEIQARDRAEAARIGRRVAEMTDDDLRQREIFYRRKGFAEAGDLVREEMAFRGEPRREPHAEAPQRPAAPEPPPQAPPSPQAVRVAVEEAVAPIEAEAAVLEGAARAREATARAAEAEARAAEAETRARGGGQPEQPAVAPAPEPAQAEPGPREQAEAALQRRIAKPRDYDLTEEQETIAERFAEEAQSPGEGVDEYGDPRVQFSSEGVTPERVREALGPDVSDELVELVSRDAVRRILARQAGRAFVKAMRKKYGDVAPGDPNADRVQVIADEEGDYAFVQRTKGKVVGAAQSLFGVRGMVGGGRPVGSPVRSQPLYDEMDRLGIKASDALSPYGKRRQVKRGEYGGSQRVPERAGQPGAEQPRPALARSAERGAGPRPEPPVAEAPPALPPAKPAVEPPGRVVQRVGEAPAVVAAPLRAEPPARPEAVIALAVPEPAPTRAGKAERTFAQRQLANFEADINQGKKVPELRFRYGLPTTVASVRDARIVLTQRVQEERAAAAPAPTAEPSAYKPTAPREEGTPKSPIPATSPTAVERAAERADETPTPAQMEAENYRKGHIRWQGFEVAIETPKGGVRQAKDGSWEVRDYPAHYGYIKRTEGKDREHVDVFLGDALDSERVFVVDQKDPETGRFDEHKVMAGFRSMDEAVNTYAKAYEKGLASKLIRSVSEVSLDQFKEWLKTGDQTKPLAPKPGRSKLEVTRGGRPRAEEAADAERRPVRPGAGGRGEAAGPGPAAPAVPEPSATPSGGLNIARRQTPKFGSAEREALDKKAAEADSRREAATQAIVQAQKLEEGARYGTDKRARLRGKRLAAEESQRKVWRETEGAVVAAQRARLEDWAEDGDPGQRVVAALRLARRDAKGDYRRETELETKEQVSQADMRRATLAEAKRQGLPDGVAEQVSRAISTDDGTVLTDGLEKVVRREARNIEAGQAKIAAREEIEAMEGLGELTGFGEKPKHARLKQVDAAYGPEDVRQALFEARADNEKGLQRKKEREEREVEKAKAEEVRQKTLLEPVAAEDVAALAKLTRAEREALEDAREPDGAPSDSLRPGRGPAKAWSAAWDKLRERGLVEPDSATFTAEGRRLAAAAQRHRDRLANGVPFSEYIPANRRVDPDAGGVTGGGWGIATVDGKNYYTNGHILVRGAPPKATAPPKGDPRLTEANIKKSLTPPKGARQTSAAAYIVDETGRRRVVFPDGTVLDADYFDHIRKAHPAATSLSAGPKAPVAFWLPSGEVVAVAMPVRWERSEWPGGVSRAVEAAGAGGGAKEPPARSGGKAFDGDEALDRLKRRGRGKAYDLGSVAGEFPGVMRDLLQYAASRIEDVFRATGRMPDFAGWARAMEDGLRGVVSGIGRHLRRLWGEARALFRRRTEAAGERRGPGITDESTSGEGAQPPPPPRGPRESEPARVPFIITQAQRSRLRDLGYSEREIDRMRPEDAQEALGAGRPAGVRRAERLEGAAGDAGRRAQKIADTFEALNEKFRIAAEGAERVQERGTIEAGERPAFREAGQPERSQTRGFRFSERDIQGAGAEMVDAVRAFRETEERFRREADPLSQEAMRAARALMEDAVRRWQVYRSAAGRAVQTFNRPIPADVIQRLREAGNLSQITGIREKVPITTNLIQSLKRWPELTDAEKRQFWRDLVDQYRLNLFSTTSFTLDLFGNAAEIGAQGVSGAAYDLIHLARGYPSFPSLQGFLRAIRTMKDPPSKIADAFDSTLRGERVTRRKDAGIFTYRGSLGSKFYDTLIGGPLYLKIGMDSAAKRFSSMAALWRDAFVEADKRGLRGADRQAFVQDFVNNPSDAAAARAIEAGNKAGFNRRLSHLEEQVAESVTARLFVAPFARWPFQFTRWAAEMVGVNPEVWRKIRSGSITPEEFGAYLARSATGLGGLYLLNQFYNRVDFNSMEYVDEDGNRIRLSGREPLATAFWLLAVIRGDEAKAYKGARYASVPFASLLGGDGGLLTSLVQSFARAAERQTVDTRAVAREIEDTINRAVPGQAVLAFVKTLTDPMVREGVGANLPGVSLLKEPAINVVTGEPLEPRQRFLGVELPSIAGTPIPGATRILEPVQKLLSRYGLLVYRGPRSPIAGLPPGEAPEELRREWVEAFGRYRAKLLEPLARAMKALEGYPEEKVRKMIQARDSMAAKRADEEIRRRFGGPRKLPRQPSFRELAGPVY